MDVGNWSLKLSGSSHLLEKLLLSIIVVRSSLIKLEKCRVFDVVSGSLNLGTDSCIVNSISSTTLQTDKDLVSFIQTKD